MVSVAVLELAVLFRSPLYAPCIVTVPAVTPVIVTVQVALLHFPCAFGTWVSVHVFDGPKRTVPLLLVDWWRVTVPVRRYPPTVTLQEMTVRDAASADLGVHETEVCEAFMATFKSNVPVDRKSLASPE